jgi:ABC-2 type transport system permease protein
MTATERNGTFGTYTWFQARSMRNTVLFWALGLVIYCGLIVAIYPSVKDVVDISLVPENLRAAFNINDFTQLASFLSSELFGVILPILLPFFGLIALSWVVAGAEERGRLDVLLGNPIPRWNLVVGSWLVVAVALLFLVSVVGTVVFTMATLLDLDLTARQAYRAAFALWPVTIVFGSFALLMSTFVRARSTALAVPAAVLFLMYLANVIARLAPSISWLRWGTVYHYYGNAIVEGLWWPGVVTLLTASGVMLLVAIVQFERRDLYA